MPYDIKTTALEFYDAAADATLWPEVLQRFADRVDAVGTILFEWRHDGPHRRLSVSNASAFYDVSQIEIYIDRCFDDEARDQDLFEGAARRGDQIEIIEDDILAPSLEALKARRNVQTLQKLGILHRAACPLNKDNPAHSRFSLQLGLDRGRFTLAEKQFIGAVLPHIAKAYDLGRAALQPDLAQTGLLAAADQLNVGICILDSQSRIVVSNTEFRAQLDRFPMVRATPSGFLKFARPEDQKRLEELKADALNHGRFGARPRKEAIAADEEVFLCIEVAPLYRAADIGSAPLDGFIVFSTDTSRPMRCQTDLLARQYRLTEAEQALVDGICDGLTNAQIAERRGRSVATINAQVKSILSKTGCATRTQLVRLMMSFGASYVIQPAPSQS